ncbi:hypothetical protein [Ornithinicoccus hortensis]|uniref:HEPN domain-containing protein n=1 Tax=Ornithinicoccus hortensis TaxID=82346 RepID=A0A542YR28_9MICO|nr:hypothetical protein [Ornithinicoccus hortensis]TQL50562.1 hypothetical protein FB467_1674 [Ornithinicoccus hortensis]
MTSQFPDIDRIAFRRDDQSDHPGGGHCSFLEGDEENGGWLGMLDQHARALRILCTAAHTDEPLTRPIIFAAHHTCEVAIKAALVQRGVAIEGELKGHLLNDLLNELGTTGWASSAPDGHQQWVAEFVAAMVAVTPNGFDGKYAELPNDMASDWCCVNPIGMLATVETFIAFVIADVPLEHE